MSRGTGRGRKLGLAKHPSFPDGLTVAWRFVMSCSKGVVIVALGLISAGCGAGIVAGALGAGGGGGGGGGGGKSAPFWEVIQPQVLQNEIEVLPRICPTESERQPSAGLIDCQIGNLPDDPAVYVSGVDLTVRFFLDRKGGGGGSDSVAVLAQVFLAGIAVGEARTYGPFIEALPPGNPIEIKVPMPASGPLSENTVVRLQPLSGREKPSQDTPPVTLDNRQSVPEVILCSFGSSECAGGVRGQVDFTFCLGSQPAGFQPVFQLFLAEENKAPVPVKTSQVEAASVECGSCPSGPITLRWDSRQDYPDESADVVPILRVQDANNGFRSQLSIISCDEKCIHIDNSPINLSDVSIASDPPALREKNRGRLVGRVIVEYSVSDRGSEPFDLEFSASFDSKRLNGVERVLLTTSEAVLTGPARKGTLMRRLTEALGAPSLGSQGLSISPDQSRYRFVWSSDFDLDQLVREGYLDRAQSTGAADFKLRVVSRGSCQQSSEIAKQFPVNNQLMHSVVGIRPGVTEPGEIEIPRGDAKFDTLVATDTNPDRSSLYFVDSGTHTVWRTDLVDPQGEVQRVFGVGTQRAQEAAESFVGFSPDLVLLDSPRDILVEGEGGRDILYVLEQNGLVWHVDVDAGVVEIALDARRFVGAARSLVREEVGSKTYFYLTDKSNCRLLRFEEGRPASEGRVLLGKLQKLNPVDETCPGAEYPQKTGCSCEGARGPISDPEGLTLFRGRDRRFLLVCDSGNSRILALDLGPNGDSEVPPAVEPVTLASKSSSEFICEPLALRIIRDELYICSKSYNFSGGRAKGIVVRRPIIDQGNSPPIFLSEFVPVAGGYVPPVCVDFTEQCGGADLNDAATYDLKDECAEPTAAKLSFPRDVSAGGDDLVYVSDSRNQRIRVIAGGTFCTYLGGSVEGRGSAVAINDVCTSLPEQSPLQGTPAVSCNLSQPLGMTLVDDSFLLVCDRGNRRILRIDLASGLVRTVAGKFIKDCEPSLQGDGGPATEATLSEPRSLAVSPSRGFCATPADRRWIYVADSFNHRVRRIDGAGVITSFAGSGDVDGRPGPDTSLANATTAADPSKVFLLLPRGVAVDSRGRVFISDCRHRIVQVDTTGASPVLRRVVGVGVALPTSLTTTCSRNPAATVADNIDPLLANLNQPSEMVFDPVARGSADEKAHYFYFADLENHRVCRILYNAVDGNFIGNLEMVAGNGEPNSESIFPTVNQRALTFPIDSPLGVAVSSNGKFLYLSDVFSPSSLYRVTLEADPEQNRITRIAGRTETGASGDGDDAVNAQLYNPNTVQLDSSGTVLYVVDSRNHRVRRFSVSRD